MNRHELKDQVQHDQFTDVVSGAVSYVQVNREKVVRGLIALAIVLLIAGGVFWYVSYRNTIRQQDLQAAFEVLDRPVGPANPSGGKSFTTQDEKAKASMKALSGVVGKDSGTRQGFIAQYYLGTLRAQNGDASGAVSDLSSVSGSGSDFAPLAKIALAQLYASQNKMPQAQDLLRELVNKPGDLVSKAQAQILLARLDETSNPQEAKKILQALKSPAQDPAVTRAADQISSQMAK